MAATARKLLRPTTTTTTPFLFLLLLFLFLALTGQAEGQQLTAMQMRQLDRLVREVMRCGKIPSLSLSLVGSGGQTMLEQGYDDGSVLGGGARTGRDTVFCLGSGTQAFTAVLLATLMSYNENKTFDTPLHEVTGSHYHLPGRFRTESVNLKDILGMRTGLSNMDMVVTAMGMNRYRLMRNLQFAPEVKPFRDEAVFNEILFALTEDAARSLAQDAGSSSDGDTWYSLLRQYLLGPLGMDDVALVHADASEKSNMALPMQRYSGNLVAIPWEAYKGREIVAAASSLCVSASDMSKWISFILRGGKTRAGQQIVSEDALQSTFQSVQSRVSDNGDTMASGFRQPTVQVSYTRESNAVGWIRGQYRGYRFLSQDGSMPGYESLTTILPERDVGVFTAFTGDGGPRAYAAKTALNIYALDLLLNGQSWLDASQVCTTIDKMAEMTSAHHPRPPYIGRAAEPIRPLEEYEGSYRNFAFGDVTVTRNESGPLELHYGELGRFTLTPTQRNDTFTLRAAQGPLWFTTHTDQYRKEGPYLAIFTPHHNDPANRISDVTLPHFDSDVDPTFSKNPPRPRRYPDDESCTCGGSRTSAGLLVLVVMGVLGAWR